MNEQNVPSSAFDAWFEKERSNGLVDIKLAISNQRGVSAQAVQNEILNIEALVQSGRTKPLPTANTFLSPEIERMIGAVTIP